VTDIAWRNSGTAIFGRGDVARLLSVRECVIAVESAFVRHARQETIPPSVLGTHVDGGGFHVKAAGMLGSAGERPLFATKINANFPANPDLRGLPTIQGIIALFDAADGRVLALMDSIEITSLRTAAATAVAAKYLAPLSAVVTICGCGEQSRHQLRALACVRSIDRVMAYDVRADRASLFARDMTRELGIEVRAIGDLRSARDATTIWVTCTPARRWFLGREHVAPGAFIAAVGADNPDKQEIEPELLASGAVVADVLDQCAAIGDLHHAIAGGLMRREDVRAELADVVSGRLSVRRTPDEVVVFDSTGTALQDVAAAAAIYARALETGDTMIVDLGGSMRP